MESLDDELVEIEENAEEKHKEAVSKKVEGIRNELDKIGKKWKWGRVKDILEEDIKNGLEAFKNEMVELEKPLQIVPRINIISDSVSDGNLIVPADRTELEELKAWREYFKGQSPEVVIRHVKGLEKFFLETDLTLTKVAKEASVADSWKKVDVQKLSESISKSAETYMGLAKQVGDASGLGLFITPAASIAAMGSTITHGLVVAGAGVYETTRQGAQEIVEKAMDGGKDLVVKVGDNITDVTTTTVNRGADVAIEGIKAVDNVGQGLKEVVMKAQDDNKELAIGAGKAGLVILGGAKDHVEKVQDDVKDLAIEAGKAGLAVLDGGKDLAEKAGEAGLAILGGGKELIENLVGVGGAQLKAQLSILAEKLEGREELIKKLEGQLQGKDKEKEKQIKRLEEEIEELKEEKRDFKKEIKELKAKAEATQDKLFAQVEEIAKSRSSSPLPPYQSNQ